MGPVRETDIQTKAKDNIFLKRQAY